MEKSNSFKGRPYGLFRARRTTGIEILCVVLLDTNELFNAITGKAVNIDSLRHTHLEPQYNYEATITGDPMHKLGSPSFYRRRVKD